MAYIGNNTVPANFQTIPSVQRFNGNGSTTAFTLTNKVGLVQDIMVSVDGVIQDTSAYTIASNGTTLTFSEAPSSGTGNIIVNFLALANDSVVPEETFRGRFKADGIFRVNNQTLSNDTTILATENASATGPLTIASGVTLNVNSGGSLAII